MGEYEECRQIIKILPQLEEETSTMGKRAINVHEIATAAAFVSLNLTIPHPSAAARQTNQLPKATGTTTTKCPLSSNPSPRLFSRPTLSSSFQNSPPGEDLSDLIFLITYTNVSHFLVTYWTTNPIIPLLLHVPLPRRPLNSTHHLILTDTGQAPRHWGEEFPG